MFKAKKPANFEGSVEEYTAKLLNGPRPKARKLTQAMIKEVYDRLNKAMKAFEGEYPGYKKFIKLESRDLTFVQGELEQEPPEGLPKKALDEWEEKRVQRIKDSWNRLRKDSEYDVDTFVKALDELKDAVRKAQALGREWGQIWL